MTYLCPKCGAKHETKPPYCARCGWPDLTPVNGPDQGLDGDFANERSD